MKKRKHANLQSKITTSRGRSKKKTSERGKQRKGRTKDKALVISGKKKVQKKSQRKSVRHSRKRHGSYSKGSGQNKHQITYWFPDIPESKKVANLRNWDGEPLQKYINANHPVQRKSNGIVGRVMSITHEPVTDKLAGYKAPQAVWVKLVKRKPRSKELFYSAVLSPSDMVINRKNVLAFSVGVLEKYYADHVGKIQDDQKVKELVNPYKLKESDPDDFEGKPMKIVAVIYHFLY